MHSKLNWQEVPPDQFVETFIERLYDKIEITLIEEEEEEQEREEVKQEVSYIYYEAKFKGWADFGKTPADAIFNLLDKITSQTDLLQTFLNKEQ